MNRRQPSTNWCEVTNMKIGVKIYPSRVYLDGTAVDHGDLQETYDELYKSLNALFFIAFT